MIFNNWLKCVAAVAAALDVYSGRVVCILLINK